MPLFSTHPRLSLLLSHKHAPVRKSVITHFVFDVFFHLFISFIVLVISLHLPNFACHIIFILTTFIIEAQIAGIVCIAISCEIRQYHAIVAGGQASLPACLPVTIL